MGHAATLRHVACMFGGGPRQNGVLLNPGQSGACTRDIRCLHPDPVIGHRYARALNVATSR